MSLRRKTFLLALLGGPLDGDTLTWKGTNPPPDIEVVPSHTPSPGIVRTAAVPSLPLHRYRRVGPVDLKTGTVEYAHEGQVR